MYLLPAYPGPNEAQKYPGEIVQLQQQKQQQIKREYRQNNVANDV